MRTSILKSCSILIFFFAISCAQSNLPIPPLPSDSLLLITPYIGSETEFRNPLPEPKHLSRNECSVVGWFAPPESVLRFPVELRENPHLSLSLTVNSRVSIESDSLRLRIEYLPDKGDPDDPQQEQLRYTIFDTTPEDTPYLLFEWINYDFDLSQLAPGTGELLFETDGRLSGDPGIDILWGQPAIYYSDEKRNKNVLLIGVDTLRRDALSIYGGREEISPNIARLAQTGTVSMVCGNPYLGSEISGFTQGMESAWYRMNATPDVTVDQMIEMIEYNRGRDQFMFLHMMDPHYPYDPPQELIDTLCNQSYIGPYRSEFTDMEGWGFLTQPPIATDVQRVRELYDAEVADVDQALAKLFNYLSVNGYLENTLIILAADHGEEFFEHNRYGHGQSLNDELDNLPLIKWGGRFPEGGKIDTPVRNIYIAPTILKYLGEPIPDDMPGTPLQDVVSDPGFENRLIFGEGNLQRSHNTKYAIDWPYKCITDYFTGVSKLFNLEDDPRELNNISGQFPDITGRLAMESTLAMPPAANMFLLLFTGDMSGAPQRFSGAVTVPGGLGGARVVGFSNTDIYSIEDNTVIFDLSPEFTPSNPVKAIAIFPSNNGDTIDVTLLADGMMNNDRFYPHGTNIVETSGHAVIIMSDLPWPNRITANAGIHPAACYVLGFPGVSNGQQQDFEHMTFDPETVEQLRALGYIN
ncbi:MAG: sulfatase-like hydrolase/transferase [bacterium]|nr:sulfatase-like hydrolase/transferase [bacterium]